jgi:mono/diheme cytochrome c family protein
MLRRVLTSSLFVLLPTFFGCDQGSGESTASPQAIAEAEQVFATRCTPCHGARGAGDGPASSGLTPRPRNFQDGAWQASVDDEHIRQIIQYGGAAVGRSLAMPANPDLQAKPEVVAALCDHIRELRQ